MKFEEIKNIVKLMSENDLTEFKIESEDMHLCIRRGSASASPVIRSTPAVPVAATPECTVAAVPAPVSAPAPALAPAAGGQVSKDKLIEAPIVGTFYRASTPGGDPFVKVGDHVSADQTVCIVEAMKTMNEIKAEKSGVIKEVLVENGEPVEFGQALFVLE